MRKLVRSLVFLSVFISVPMGVFAAWDLELKAGYDSNVNRSLEDEEADSYVNALLMHTYQSQNYESLVNWSVSTMVQAGSYADNSDLNFIGISCAPALVLTPEARWLVRIGPYVGAQQLKDEDQSAVSFGGMLALDARWPHAFYSSQYYTYTDSNAEVETYSYTEHTLGAVLGRMWGKSWWSEIEYGYTDGTSFITVPSSTTITTITSVSGRGRGSQLVYSTVYDADVFRDDITRHTGGISLGYNGMRFSPYIGYRYSREKGDFGTIDTHVAFAALRWKIK